MKCTTTAPDAPDRVDNELLPDRIMSMIVVLEIIIALVLAFMATDVFVTRESFAQGSPFDQPLTIRVRGDAQSQARFDDGGEVGTATMRMDVNWSIFDFHYSRTEYSWSRTGSLPFATGVASPVSGTNRLALGASYGDRFLEDWSWFVAARGTASFEEQMDGSFGGAFRAGVGWEFLEDWELQMGGVLFVNNIDTRPLPLLRLNYHGVDESGSGFFGTLGVLEVEAGYQFDKTLNLTAGFNMDSGTTRLADDSRIREKGYLETEAYVASLTAEWKFAKGWQLVAGPEFRFGRQWTVYDKNGKNKKKYDLGDCLGGTLSLRYRF